MNKLFTLRSDAIRQRVQMWLSSLQIDPEHPLEVVIREPTRNLQQNSLLHALLQEVSETRQWSGKSWDVLTWKRLLTAAWMRAEGMRATVLPALDGAGVDVIYEPTHTMSKADISSLIEYVKAWMAEAEAA